jgi:molecular chaperone DnaK
VIETSLEQLRTAQKQQDLSGIEAATTALNTAWTAASEELYKASQQAGQGPQAGGEGTGSQQAAPDSENVQDVPYEEVK